MITRYYSDLSKWFLPGKAIIIYGPRQVGKTTLLSNFLSQEQAKYLLINGDNIRAREVFSSQSLSTLSDFVEGYSLLVIDEAQMIPSIGKSLKLLVDSKPDLRIIATGSSSFELAGQVGEPLTGRKRTLTMFPVWSGELLNQMNRYELNELLPELLIYGFYPEVINTPGILRKQEILEEITNSYLLKDILVFERVKSSKMILDVLRLLAYQVGKEVSVSEIAQQVGLDKKTVARYLDLLEKAFVIINVRGYNRNLRNEITSKSKYYFYDNGVRNAVIANFNRLELRNDIGMLWENHVFMERLKKRSYQNLYANVYFWRTWQQQEIDIVEERDGKLFGYECKWKNGRAKAPKAFMEAYPESSWEVIDQNNYANFIL